MGPWASTGHLVECALGQPKWTGDSWAVECGLDVGCAITCCFGDGFYGNAQERVLSLFLLLNKRAIPSLFGGRRFRIRLCEVYVIELEKGKVAMTKNAGVLIIQGGPRETAPGKELETPGVQELCMELND